MALERKTRIDKNIPRNSTMDDFISRFMKMPAQTRGVLLGVLPAIHRGLGGDVEDGKEEPCSTDPATGNS